MSDNQYDEKMRAALGMTSVFQCGCGARLYGVPHLGISISCRCGRVYSVSVDPARLLERVDELERRLAHAEGIAASVASLGETR